MEGHKSLPQPDELPSEFHGVVFCYCFDLLNLVLYKTSGWVFLFVGIACEADYIHAVHGQVGFFFFRNLSHKAARERAQVE